jgi:hypothetical protein
VLRFDWNALRIDDEVLVHDPDTVELALVPGVVALVDSHRRENGVGIRIVADGRAVVLWPARLAVHRAPRNATEQCWRCDTATGLVGSLSATTA